jgi:hypothetical protein
MIGAFEGLQPMMRDCEMAFELVIASSKVSSHLAKTLMYLSRRGAFVHAYKGRGSAHAASEVRSLPAKKWKQHFLSQR